MPTQAAAPRPVYKPLADRTSSEGTPRAQPGTMAYLAEQMGECVAILKKDNDDAAAAIASTPIAGDVLRLRALLEQRPVLTELEIKQLGFLAREALFRIQTKHFRRVDEANALVGILTDIGVDPEVTENGRVEVTCMSAAEMMNIGALLTEQYPREAASVIEASRYDAVRFVCWWDLTRLDGYRAAA